MLNIFAIFIGRGIGAVLRYITGIIFLQILKTNLPIATLVVNIAGCFIIGLLYILFTQKLQINPSIKLALTAGFCGGLTTFSTFSLEIFEMIQNNQILYAVLYISISLFLGLLAVYFGGYCAKFL